MSNSQDCQVMEWIFSVLQYIVAAWPPSSLLPRFLMFQKTARGIFLPSPRGRMGRMAWLYCHLRPPLPSFTFLPCAPPGSTSIASTKLPHPLNPPPLPTSLPLASCLFSPYFTCICFSFFLSLFFVHPSAINPLHLDPTISFFSSSFLLPPLLSKSTSQD